MNEKEYRKHPGLNFSNLAAFYNKGIYSPDHALLKFHYKSYFEYGKMFESMLQDAATGSNEFGKRFYQSKVDGKMPDELIKWIDEKEDLNQFYKFNKDGSKSKTCKTKHAYLDEAQLNIGKIPVSVKDWDLLHRHTENMLKMEYLDSKVSDLLSSAQWQVPVIFEDYDGLTKKALIDCLVDLGGSQYLLIDIKTTANFKQFFWMLKEKYFIQDLHYTKAVNLKYGDCEQMVFFVASKEAPFLCSPFMVDYGGIDFKSSAIEEYMELCEAYKKWIDGGKKPKGWLPLQTVKHYFKTD
jgi:hypothetical protein